NNGLDTAWISPFGITYPALTPLLTSVAGSPVPRLIGVTDDVPAPGWRGVPIAPGDRLYDTTVLQDWWGAADSAARGLFIRHLSPGSYDLSATFNSEVWPDAASAARLASLRAAVADEQRSLPAGAYAVDAGYADRPELVPPLARALGQSLAGAVAAQREKEHRSKARPRQ